MKHFEIRRKCPACESANFHLIHSERYLSEPLHSYLRECYRPRGGLDFGFLEGAIYALCECNDCRLIFQQYVPGDELMSHIYNPKFSADKRNRVQPFRPHKQAEEVMQLLTLFRGREHPFRVLDFGLGWGRWAMMAKAFGCDVYGTELDRHRAELARRNGITIVDSDDLPLQHFDLINTEQVFEHLPQPLQTLRRLALALRPQGVVKISVPNSHGIERALKRVDWSGGQRTVDGLNPVAPLQHINCFRRGSLTAMGNAAGLTEVQIGLWDQYAHIALWGPMRGIVRRLLSPINRNLLRRSNYVLFRGS